MTEVAKKLAHHTAVDLVVPLNVSAELRLAQSDSAFLGFPRCTPRGGHGTEAIGRAVGPTGLDQTLAVERLSKGLKPKPKSSAGNCGLLLHDSVEEVEPTEFGPGSCWMPLR